MGDSKIQLILSTGDIEVREDMDEQEVRFYKVRSTRPFHSRRTIQRLVGLMDEEDAASGTWPVLRPANNILGNSMLLFSCTRLRAYYRDIATFNTKDEAISFAQFLSSFDKLKEMNRVDPG